jgi:hypothetical protein
VVSCSDAFRREGEEDLQCVDEVVLGAALEGLAVIGRILLVGSEIGPRLVKQRYSVGLVELRSSSERKQSTER